MSLAERAADTLRMTRINGSLITRDLFAKVARHAVRSA